MKNTHIPLPIVQNFIKREKLRGAVSFLNYLRKKDGIANFVRFCAKKGTAINTEEMGAYSVLFHGSNTRFNALKPNFSVGKDGKPEISELVYATNNPNYAIFLGILHLKNGGAGVTVIGKKTNLSVDLDFVNGSSKFKNGYVHVISGRGFKKLGNDEFSTDQTANVLFSFEVNPNDLTESIVISL